MPTCFLEQFRSDHPSPHRPTSGVLKGIPVTWTSLGPPEELAPPPTCDWAHPSPSWALTGQLSVMLVSDER